MPQTQGEIKSKNTYFNTFLPYSLEEIKFFRDCRIGGPGFVTRHLLQHWKEKGDHFDDRVKRAVYSNFIKDILAIYTGFFTKQKIARSGEGTKEKAIISFVADTTKKEQDISTFLASDVLPSLLSSGRVFIMTDNSKFEEGLSEEEATALKIRPYSYVIPTEDVIDFKVVDGEIVWIKYKTLIVDSSDIFNVTTKVKHICITKNEIHTLEVPINVVDGEIKPTTDLIYLPRNNWKTVPNTLGFVPITYKELLFGGAPFLSDICYLSKKYLNIDSLLDELLYRQTFSQMIFPHSNNVTLAERKVGTSYALTYPKDAKNPPAFIAPLTGPPTTLITVLERIEQSIRNKAHNSTEATTANISTTTKEYDFNALNQILIAISACMQSIEINLYKMVYNYIDGKTFEQGTLNVEYPKTFSLLSLLDDITNYFEVLKLNLSGKVNKACKEGIVDIAFTDKTQALTDEYKKSLNEDPVVVESQKFSRSTTSDIATEERSNAEDLKDKEKVEKKEEK